MNFWRRVAHHGNRMLRFSTELRFSCNELEVRRELQIVCERNTVALHNTFSNGLALETE